MKILKATWVLSALLMLTISHRSPAQIDVVPGGLLFSDTAYAQMVKCSLRDKAGNLWFGTSWNGLFRYDGKTFTRFSEKDGLCSNSINVICEDAKGTLWLGTGKGVCRYDGKRFTHFLLQPADAGSAYLPDPNRQKNPSASVESIIQDKAGNMWFGLWIGHGGTGAYRYDGKTLTPFSQDMSVQGIVEDNKGGVWMNYKQYKGNTVTDFSQTKNGAYELGIFCGLKDKDGNLWFGIRANGVYRYDGKAFTYFTGKDGLFDNRVACIFQDKAGGIWMGSDVVFNETKGGLCRYNGKTFTHFPDMFRYGMYSVLTVAEDKNGYLWLGGRGSKLLRYDGKTFTDFSGSLGG